MTDLSAPPDSLYGQVHDVSNPQFPTALRGYDRARVDAYVAAVSALVAELEATHPDSAVRAALERVGEETSSILKRAHDTAADITARTREQVQALLASARAQAEQIVADAHALRDEVDRDTDLLWRERTKMIEDTRALADELLGVADRALERFPAETEPDPAAVELDDHFLMAAAFDPTLPAAAPMPPGSQPPAEAVLERFEPPAEPSAPAGRNGGAAEPDAPAAEVEYAAPVDEQAPPTEPVDEDAPAPVPPSRRPKRAPVKRPRPMKAALRAELARAAGQGASVDAPVTEVDAVAEVEVAPTIEVPAVRPAVAADDRVEPADSSIEPAEAVTEHGAAPSEPTPKPPTAPRARAPRAPAKTPRARPKS